MLLVIVIIAVEIDEFGRSQTEIAGMSKRKSASQRGITRFIESQMHRRQWWTAGDTAKVPYGYSVTWIEEVRHFSVKFTKSANWVLFFSKTAKSSPNTGGSVGGWRTLFQGRKSTQETDGTGSRTGRTSDERPQASPVISSPKLVGLPESPFGYEIRNEEDGNCRYV